MTYAFDIPGYVQGFRFSDDERFFYTAAGRFRDLAGYDHLGNGCQVVRGTPTFAPVNGNTALLLDNTCHLEFLPSIPWEGSVLIAGKPTSNAGASKYLLLFGDRVQANTNGRMTLQRFQAGRSIGISTSGTGITETKNGNDDALVAAFSLSQQTRKAYSTQDGVSVKEAVPVPAAANGNGLSLGTTNSSDNQGVKARLGVLLGNDSDLSAQTDVFLHIWELHFWKGNVLVDHLPAAKAFIERLVAKYTG